MAACLTEEPAERPTFSQVIELLRDVSEEVAQGQYLNSRAEPKPSTDLDATATAVPSTHMQAANLATHDRWAANFSETSSVHSNPLVSSALSLYLAQKLPDSIPEETEGETAISSSSKLSSKLSGTQGPAEQSQVEATAKITEEQAQPQQSQEVAKTSPLEQGFMKRLVRNGCEKHFSMQTLSRRVMLCAQCFPVHQRIRECQSLCPLCASAAFVVVAVRSAPVYVSNAQHAPTITERRPSSLCELCSLSFWCRFWSMSFRPQILSVVGIIFTGHRRSIF
eukprot:TRINITY_DN7458_c1_g1_i1.p1 TRINITY_DN7458_c1_g1~~TRINITY_DN7458_c1_g1_i1.p1  ORF type:complete len:308 (-),score=15.84 TRINITY_DN7458_c1_g1_i1:163-1002(-)